jgi:hypothetical protein
VNGACELWVRACVNPAGVPCSARAGIAAFHLVEPSSDADEVVLERTLAVLDRPAVGGCAPLTRLTVPVRRSRRGGATTGRKRLRLRATSLAGTRTDVHRVFRCAPRPSATGASFVALQREVFAAACGTSACHGAAAGGLTLVGRGAWAALVNQPSTASSKRLVVPGLPGASFLLDKLRGTLAPGEGAPMPLDGPPLGASQIAAIEQWIADGAPRRRGVGGAPRASDAQPRFPDPPVPPGGFQVAMVPTPLGDAAERTGCELVRLSNPDDIYASRIELVRWVGAHHFALAALQCQDLDGNGTNDCDEAGFDARFPPGLAPCRDFRERYPVEFVAESSGPVSIADYRTAETGIAHRMHRRQPLLVNSHFVNRYRDTIAAGWVNVVPAPAALVRHQVEVASEGGADGRLTVPPGTQRTVRAVACAFTECGEGQRKRPVADRAVLLAIDPHFHWRARNLLVDVLEPGGTPVSRGAADMIDPADGSRHFFVATDPTHLARRTVEPMLPVVQGRQVQYACDYDNGVTRPVKLGCEEQAGVIPGRSLVESLRRGDGPTGGTPRSCRADADCAGFGTGRCVPANLVFGELSDDAMCNPKFTFYRCSADGPCGP